MELLQSLKSLLLKHVQISYKNCPDKNVKGVFSNYVLNTEQNGFGIRIDLICDGKEKIIRVPYPFGISHESNQLILDYRLNTIFSDPKHRRIIKEIDKKYTNDIQPNKFYNNVVIIKF